MAERTPPTAAIKQAWIVGHPFRATTTVEGREAEFDRWLAEVRREAAEKAVDQQHDCDYLRDEDCKRYHHNPYRKEADRG